ncbi:MAG: hypothetical protein DRR16_31200 [Candidatus Parabeggiatoa sp. nov. 3]|jgi:hypothetical protein|nr:MAG: hypothetical protein DRR00_14305 [Gammaproteobacteria bacterium]RKZ60961.1 MAG: hypothetical protein DRQ99_21245 [Gammaproteobacteria bacterium]RKZ75524.1 MAG: hypothetical protein DRR16_31200 [Gammaproteobacteria bacterium]
MPALHIQSMPQDLYRYLQQLAVAQNRTVETQVIAVLSQFKQEKREQQASILADIYHSRLELPSDAPDSTTLLQEDRAR